MSRGEMVGVGVPWVCRGEGRCKKWAVSRAEGGEEKEGVRVSAVYVFVSWILVPWPCCQHSHTFAHPKTTIRTIVNRRGFCAMVHVRHVSSSRSSAHGRYRYSPCTKEHALSGLDLRQMGGHARGMTYT